MKRLDEAAKKLIFALFLLAATSPVLANEPFQARVEFTIPAGSTVDCEAITIPADHRLTVEFASVLISASTTGQQLTGVVLYTRLASVSSSAESFNVIPVTPIDPPPNQGLLGYPFAFQAAIPLKAYADDDTNTRLCVFRAGTSGSLSIYGTVNGTIAAN